MSLELDEYAYYSRQLILPQLGLPGQLKLKSTHLLVIGAGGLGSPLLLYLAATGIGEISIFDHDQVEISNLHRQVIHSLASVGINKAESAAQRMRSINPFVKINVFPFAFDSHLFSSTPSDIDSPSSSTAPLSPQDFHRVLARETMEYTMIVDCTDTPTSRHFINAFALAYRIPLVSGGAVRTDGVVGVYALPLASSSTPEESTMEEIETGPCYACVFPPSPPPIPLHIPSSDPSTSPVAQKIIDDAAVLAQERSEESAALLGTGACSDEGVLGLLCGVVGLGMGSEVTRGILGLAKPTLHLYSPLSDTPYRTIKMRKKLISCKACGEFVDPSPTSTKSTSRTRWDIAVTRMREGGSWSGEMEKSFAVQGGGVSAVPNRVTVKFLSERDSDWFEGVSGASIGSSRDGVELAGRGNAVIIDVRSETEFGLCSLPSSINIPLSKSLRDPKFVLSSIQSSTNFSSSTVPPSSTSTLPSPTVSPTQVYFVCKQGNDSWIAARNFRRYLSTDAAVGDAGGSGQGAEVFDVVGGIRAWAKEVDPSFPVY